MALAMPKTLSTLIRSQDGSNSYQAMPWRAEVGCAWWLLCQPSPKEIAATHQLLRESSRVAKRRAPHMWVAEFTSQVAWRPATMRTQFAQRTIGRPPKINRTTVSATIGTQCQLFSQT